MASWPGILDPPRRRRRLGRLAAALGVAAAIAGTIALVGGSSESKQTFESGTPTFAGQEKSVRLTPAARRAVGRTLERFVRDGVARGNLAAAYDLVTSNLRATRPSTPTRTLRVTSRVHGILGSPCSCRWRSSS